MNYYNEAENYVKKNEIDKIVENNWSVRSLRAAIKANEYERLVNKPDKIEIKQNKEIINIDSDLKNPIVVNIAKDTIIKTKKDLEKAILA